MNKKMRKKLMFGPWITDVERNMVADALTEESMYEKEKDGKCRPSKEIL